MCCLLLMAAVASGLLNIIIWGAWEKAVNDDANRSPKWASFNPGASYGIEVAATGVRIQNI